MRIRAGAGGTSGMGRTGVLTRQEREIVTPAAAGLSNKQIAEKLFLSPRTISSHLYRAFPKLGVASRAALRDALDGLQRQELHGNGVGTGN